ncbi:hypothetical protein scyTo_0005684 [Scyliorhinus torazame]|uniref:Uncharacterized protein n=1 Tax=Scyliorhinus torazame TaxID=75743 RepID=A0A401PBH6_SCYTO|nr:hypothetical protein [Scyliorhinus torazame]
MMSVVSNQAVNRKHWNEDKIRCEREERERQESVWRRNWTPINPPNTESHHLNEISFHLLPPWIALNDLTTDYSFSQTEALHTEQSLHGDASERFEEKEHLRRRRNILRKKNTLLASITMTEIFKM